MTKVQRDAIASPVPGLLIYQNNSTPGFYFFTGSTWTQLGGSFANRSLNNLTSTAINQSLFPSIDNSIDLGSSTNSWRNLWVDGQAYFNNELRLSPNFALSGSPAGAIRWTGTDFEGFDGSLWKSFTAMGGGGGDGGANLSLSNLTPTAVNIDLLPAINKTYNLGSDTRRWDKLYLQDSLMFAGFQGIRYQNTSWLFGTNCAEDTIGARNVYVGHEAGKSSNVKTNGNILLGYQAGFLQDTADLCVLIGDYAGYGNKSSDIIAIGSGAGGDNEGLKNIFIGRASGQFLKNGHENTFIGYQTFVESDTGSFNTLIGMQSGLGLIGSSNTMIGRWAGLGLQGNFNAIFGVNSGFYAKGNGNTFMGHETGKLSIAGYTTLMGYTAGYSLTTGGNNTFLGSESGAATTEGSSNTFVGRRSGFENIFGYKNTVIGYDAGRSDIKGNSTVCIGAEAGYSGMGKKNVILGAAAGGDNTDSTCVYIGYLTGQTTGAYSLVNAVAIGSNADVSNSNTMRFGNSSMNRFGFGKNCSSTSVVEFQTTTAKLTTGGVWTNASDRRLKNNTQRLNKSDILHRINELPIERWHYLADPEGITHIGPYSQDFYQLFEVGDDTTVSTIDPAGVALIGIQALTEQTKALKSENEQLLERLNQLEQTVSNLSSDLAVCCVRASSNLTKPTPSLGQNIPNPAKNSVSIPYTVPVDCHSAEIRFADLASGRQIASLPISCRQNALQLDLAMFPSTSYSYTLWIDGALIDTRIMVVAR